MKRGHGKRSCCRGKLLAIFVFALSVPGALAQSGAAVESGPAVEATGAQEVFGSNARRFHMEATGFDNVVSNDFGHWAGTGIGLSYQQSERLAVSGEVILQRRPGETERLFAFGALANWSKWFYTNLTLSGGGPDNPAAFFPRFRYDATANLKIPPLPGLILTGGLTRLYFGNPVNGRVSRAGAIYYWRNFVFQGSLNFNNVRPGNQKSKSVSGAVQYGREGSYWVGLVAGGGREAWQTLALTPQDVEFSSYSTSVFVRKWLGPSYGIAAAYSYSLKRTAYQTNGLEMKFFLDF
ncbi:MAG: YaiO family outer membrane beta-barrel protein [Acidobacteria bacterium]|nr:YaiO family outer membrane beta-barrel protein [Acidobacteriota bacterium]